MFPVWTVLITLSALEAYDVHHPNPMSILNGHHTPSRSKSKPEPEQTKLQPWRMYQRRSEGRYIVRPEPYSLEKKQSDPELLGPQRTYTTRDREHNRTAASLPNDPRTPPATREECISRIGQAKFDSYVHRYGGEAGALQRCRILLRMLENPKKNM